MKFYRQCIPSLIALISVLHLVSGFASGQADEKSKTESFRISRSLLKYAVDCIQTDSLQSALKALDSVLTIDHNNADAYYYRGLIHLQNGDSARAIEELSTGTAVAPLASRVRLLLARIYLASDKVGQAIIPIDEILAIKPSEGEALYLKGRSLLAVQDTAAALEKLEQAILVKLSEQQ